MTAVDYGADAVYMGAPKFGARYAAGNTIEDIASAVEYARRYGVRIYCTLNTILFDNELDAARRQAEEVIAAGVDALIIQDMAYMEMGLQSIEFHASTQTFNASPEKVKFMQKAGFSRVILERNLTLQQIEAIRAATSVELEAFVNGAICVCHSGRCYMSRTMSSRSGNRGECSQPCRLTYDLLKSVNREEKQYETLIAGKHLLSVQDLDLSARTGDLLDAGITSFKIEGRLKDINYVKNTINYYRRRLDEEMAARPGMRRSSSGATVADFTPDLSKTFTRGRSEYFLGGKRHGVASFDTPKALGEYLGKVTAADKGWLELGGKQAVSAGDGICFFSAGELAGTNVNRVEGRRIYPNRELRLPPGTEIYRNYDHKFSSMLAKSRTRRTIDVKAQAVIGSDRIHLALADEDGISTTASLYGNFEPAENPEKAKQTVRDQISKSGDTIFRITDIEMTTDGAARFVPASTLNAMRREALDKLLWARLQRPPHRNIPEPSHSLPYPYGSVPATENVTNRLAEGFYRRHGATHIEPGLDTLDDLHERTVMRTPYCIRRETGRCTKTAPEQNTDLFLRRGNHTYRLRFDCAECIMEVIFDGGR